MSYTAEELEEQMKALGGKIRRLESPLITLMPEDEFRRDDEQTKLWELYALAPASYRCDSSLTDERKALTCMELAKVFLAAWKAETEAPAVDPDAVSDQEMERQLAKQEGRRDGL